MPPLNIKLKFVVIILLTLYQFYLMKLSTEMCSVNMLLQCSMFAKYTYWLEFKFLTRKLNVSLML